MDTSVEETKERENGIATAKNGKKSVSFGPSEAVTFKRTNSPSSLSSAERTEVDLEAGDPPTSPHDTIDLTDENTEDTPIPSWVPPNIFSSDNINPLCKDTEFITTDCLASAVLKDIQKGEQFLEGDRLAVRANATLRRYRKDMENFENEHDTEKKEKLRIAMDKHYPNRDVLIRTETGVQPFTVRNPYRALQSREEANLASFANPVTTETPPATKANVELLREIAPTEIIRDNRYAISLLESLWFCGSNPTLSNDPRCFPLQLLGELHEYSAAKEQKSHAISAKKILAHSSWPAVRKMVVALRNSIKGTNTFPLIVLPEKQTYEEEKEENGDKETSQAPTEPLASAPPVTPSPVPLPPLPSPNASPVPLRIRLASPPEQIPIVPRRLGAFGGFRPILPVRLGALPRISVP
jgi:hypothetical protein